jgi:arylsulfatase
MGATRETAGFPQIYNIEADPKERVDITVQGFGWTVAPYLQLIAQYQATLKDHPNPPAGNVTKF